MLRRLLIALPLTAAAAWLTISISGANIMRQVRPDLAMKFQPSDARAAARAAELSIARPPLSRSAIDEAEALALASLRRDPTVASAWRSLALAAAARNQPERSARLFHFVGGLTRRDLPTQLWLIEERVQRNDVAGALSMYDATLRTSAVSQDILLPILVSATGDASLLRPLANLLNTRPPWRQLFLERLAAEAPSADNQVRLLELIRPAAGEEDAILFRGMMARLVEQRQFGAAARIYAMLSRTGPVGSRPLRNGGFEAQDALPPFEWQIEDGAEIGAARGAIGDGRPGLALRVRAASGVSGTVARQLLMLPAGDHEAAALVGAPAGPAPAQLALKVRCANPQATSLAAERVAPQARPVRVSVPFRVPSSDCPAQWLEIDVASDVAPGERWIDDVSIRPTGG